MIKNRGKCLAFPRQATLAYLHSFLKAVRDVRALTNQTIIFDAAQTVKLSSLFLCFFCGLFDFAIEKRNRIKWVLPRNKKSAEVLHQIKNIAKTASKPTWMISERQYQLRKITSQNSEPVDSILVQLARQITIDNDLTFNIRVVLTELLTDALDHSGEKSCYISAGISGKSHFLQFSILDFGVGIPQKIRTRYPELQDDLEAIKSMLERRLTTRVDLEGGNGYRLIQKILRFNRGRLQLISGGVRATFSYDRGEYTYHRIRHPFVGTCVNLQFDRMGKGFYSAVKDDSESRKDYF